MGFPGNSGDSNRHTNGADKSHSNPFGRLKAATGFAKSKPGEKPMAPMTPANDVAPVSCDGAGPSVLSANVEMTGSVTSPNELHLYGSIDGNVRAKALTIFAGGVVKGDVVAETVLIHGEVDGRVHGQKVQLFSGAVVRGDITHGSLGLDAGAVFEGASKRSENPLAEAPAIAPRKVLHAKLS
jgi:cytoskeletal protein CcmA (bactofilin family)